MEKKLRIQLFSEEGIFESDRLVTQDPELVKGPKSPHKGPIRIEFTLTEQDDTEKVVKYLQQLSGTLPLTTKKLKAQKTELDDVSDEEMKDWITTIIEETQDVTSLIGALRKEGFHLMVSDYLIQVAGIKLAIKEVHLDKYQWFIRKMKGTANPATDKWDPRILFGVKYVPELGEKVVTYVDGEFNGNYTMEIGKANKEVFKKTSEAALKFPHYLTEEDRAKFRYDLRKMVMDKEKIPSKFLNRWAEYVENVPEDVLSRINK